MNWGGESETSPTVDRDWETDDADEENGWNLEENSQAEFKISFDGQVIAARKVSESEWTNHQPTQEDEGKAAPSGEDFESRLEHSMEVEAGGTLVVQAEVGTINLTTHDADSVDVVVTRVVRADDQEQADQLFAMHEVNYDLAEFELVPGQDAAIVAKFNEDFKAYVKEDNHRWNRIRKIELDIAIPSTFDLRIEASGGNITIPDVQGDVVVATSGGNASMANVDGSIRAASSGGNLEVGGCTQSLELTTSGGNAIVENILGKAKITSSGGNIFANLAVAPEADLELISSGGNMKIGLDPSLQMDIEAFSSVGHILAPFIDKKTNQMVKSLNGGGKKLRARVSAGNIEFHFLENQPR